MSRPKERIKDELRELLPPTIFFLVASHIIAIPRSLMLREFGVNLSAAAGATIGALPVGTVVLSADKRPMGRSVASTRRHARAAGHAS